MGLYGAAIFRSHQDYVNDPKSVLFQWHSNHAIAISEATKDMSGYSLQSFAPGEFVIDDQHYRIPNPRGGRIIDG
jgi:hypothetical protein